MDVERLHALYSTYVVFIMGYMMVDFAVQMATLFSLCMFSFDVKINDGVAKSNLMT